MIVKILLGIVMLVVMAAAAYGLTKYVLLPSYNKFKLGTSSKKQVTASTDAPMGYVYTMKSISVNPLFSKGTRFVVAGLAVEYTNKDLEDELKERDPQIRDAMIRYYRRHTADQMLDITFQEKSRDELTSMINSLLTKGQIDSLYYTELILQ